MWGPFLVIQAQCPCEIQANCDVPEYKAAFTAAAKDEGGLRRRSGCFLLPGPLDGSFSMLMLLLVGLPRLLILRMLEEGFLVCDF